jgi:hypothetical protein
MMNDNRPGEGDTDEPNRAYIVEGHWRKSSFSMNGDCVEVALLRGDHVGVRDSKATAGPHLRFSSDTWTGFLKGIQGVHSSYRGSTS